MSGKIEISKTDLLNHLKEVSVGDEIQEISLIVGKNELESRQVDLGHVVATRGFVATKKISGAKEGEIISFNMKSLETTLKQMKSDDVIITIGGDNISVSDGKKTRKIALIAEVNIPGEGFWKENAPTTPQLVFKIKDLKELVDAYKTLKSGKFTFDCSKKGVVVTIADYPNIDEWQIPIETIENNMTEKIKNSYPGEYVSKMIDCVTTDNLGMSFMGQDFPLLLSISDENRKAFMALAPTIDNEEYAKKTEETGEAIPETDDEIDPTEEIDL